MAIGYKHYEESVMSDPHLPPERKEAWKQFEDIRAVLYDKYVQIVSENRRLQNSELESAIREITCAGNNRDLASNIAQWRRHIEQWTTEDKYAPLKTALLEVLEHYSQES